MFTASASIIHKYCCIRISTTHPNVSRLWSIFNNKSVQRSYCSSASSPASSITAAKQSSHPSRRLLPTDGPDLNHFIRVATATRQQQQAKIIPPDTESDSYLSKDDYFGDGRKIKFITYGCQMNVNDMETVRSILFTNGYQETDDEKMADIIMVMTCSIREGAEQKIWRLLKKLRRKPETKRQTIAVLGCMAERIRHQFLSVKEAVVDVVAGPDSYRDLPRLLAVTRSGHSAINVQLSLEETYADIAPVRVDSNAKSAFVSIMRGCDNMCTYCIVPFTRGRERSRPLSSIVDEVKRLSDQGYKQVILLGQNVNSYRDMSESSHSMRTIDDPIGLAPGFKTVYKPKEGGLSFGTLLERVSDVDPEMRIRFTSPHPKDFPFQVLELIKERHNICKQIHLPAQSGSNTVLESMRRGYTRQSYLALVDQIKQLIPGVALTSDFIAGFCGETEQDHQQTLDLIRRVRYSFCYVFPYSMREKTKASYHLVDDVAPDVKRRRHEELAHVFREGALQINCALIGTLQLVLLESQSKRSATALAGRADNGTKVIVENSCLRGEDGVARELKPGDYVAVLIEEATSQTLIAKPLIRTTLQQFTNEQFRVNCQADLSIQ